jgi:nitrous oxidase accessory protein NosD
MKAPPERGYPFLKLLRTTSAKGGRIMLPGKRFPVGVLLLITSCLMMVDNSHAATLTVGQPNTACPNAQYSTITAAVNAAAPGDVIEICPALYPEQLIITKPLTLRGVPTNVNIGKYLPCCNAVKRVLLQPTLQDLMGLPFEAVITVMNTAGVTIDNLAFDASQNTVASCDIALSAVHFYNASGLLKNSAVFGAQLPNPQNCSTFFGNGFGVAVDSSEAGPFHVEIENNSIHDFQRDGIEVTSAGVNVTVQGNNISGLGPSTGINQFGVFLLNGAVGQIKSNIITEGACGTLSPTDCYNLRSEGVVLRSVGDGTVVNNNVINHVQSGIFLNAVNRASITNNLIGNVDSLDGIDMQGTSNSLVDGNIIFNATPLNNLSEGVFEAFGAGTAGGFEANNQISNNTVNDAYCGVAFVATSHVTNNRYFNVLYPKLLSNGQPGPPPTEPPLP